MSAPTLRPYQEAGLDAIAQAREAGHNRQLLQMATGTGKTVLFAALPRWPAIRSWLETFPGRRRMLVIAHREELLEQAAEKILRANPELLVSIEQADRYASQTADVVVASIQTLAARSFRRLHRLLQPGPFRLVIVDEAHHAAASTYRTTLVHLGFLPPADASETQSLEAPAYDDVVKMQQALTGWDAQAPKDRLLLGVTATPNRTDAIGLGCVFQTIVYSYGLKPAIGDGHLVPIVPWVIETETNLDAVHLTAGDFNQRELAEAVNTSKRNQLAVAAWREHAADRSTLAFTVDVAHAHSLAEAFNQTGIVARPLSGETPKDERRQLLADYTAGRVQVLTNCMVLTEGTDLPRTGCILHAKPTKSATLYEQMTGRGLRPHPEKRDCLVIDVVDVARRHSLQTAPVLYGLPPGLVTQGQSLQQIESDLEKLRAQYDGVNLEQLLGGQRLTLAQLAAKATTFDIWKIQPVGATLGEGREFAWVKISDDVYRLSYPWNDASGAEGNETIQISRDMLGHFEVVLTWRERTLSTGPWKQPQTRQRTLVREAANAEAAAILAETFIRNERREVRKLKAADAPWQKRPASEKQINYLRRLRVPFKEGLTMGQAGRLIDMAMARRGGSRR